MEVGSARGWAMAELLLSQKKQQMRQFRKGQVSSGQGAPLVV
jgi:hypothetical protein